MIMSYTPLSCATARKLNERKSSFQKYGTTIPKKNNIKSNILFQKNPNPMVQKHNYYHIGIYAFKGGQNITKHLARMLYTFLEIISHQNLSLLHTLLETIPRQSLRCICKSDISNIKKITVYENVR